MSDVFTYQGDSAAIIGEYHTCKWMTVAMVPKLLWICTWVKVGVINNKTTWVRVKSTGSKRYLSKKYKVSLKNTWSTK
jgi:hypothetical protein